MLACLFAENVNDEVKVIENHPAAFRRSGLPVGLGAFRAHFLVTCVGQCLDMARVVAGADDIIIGYN